MAEPVHAGAPLQPVDANQLPGWMRNTGSQFGVIGDAWKVTANTSMDRGIKFNVGTGWSDGILTEFDETNIPAPFSLPSSAETQYYMIVSRVNWQEPFTRTFVAIPAGGTRALPITSVDYKRQPGVIADFPVALVQVPGGSTQLGEIVDLRLWAGDGGWMGANSGLVKQYITRPMSTVEIDGALHRLGLDNTWGIVGYTNEPLVDPYRHLVLDTPISIGSAANTADYKTVVGFKAGRGDGGNVFPLTYSNGVVTVAQAGTYVIDGQLTFNAGPVSTRVAAFNVSGVRYRNWAANIGYRHTLPLHKELRLDVGATVSMQAWQDSGSTIPLIGDDDQTTWTIRRVGR